MKPVDILIPESAKIVFNNLYDTVDPSLLTPDLLAIALPNKTYIDVSWYPEEDPSGEYTMTVYRDSWTDQLMEYSSANLSNIVTAVEDAASKFCEPVMRTSSALLAHPPK